MTTKSKDDKHRGTHHNGNNLNKNKKMNLVLDLDNTVICSLSFDEVEKISKSQQKVIDKLRYVDMGKYYRVYFRPYIHEFLDYIFKYFISRILPKKIDRNNNYI